MSRDRVQQLHRTLCCDQKKKGKVFLLLKQSNPNHDNKKYIVTCSGIKPKSPSSPGFPCPAISSFITSLLFAFRTEQHPHSKPNAKHQDISKAPKLLFWVISILCSFKKPRDLHAIPKLAVALVVKNLPTNAGDKTWGFSPWVGKTFWRRKWWPAPVSLPGEFYGPRSLGSYSPWGCKELYTTEAT